MSGSGLRPRAADGPGLRPRYGARGRKLRSGLLIAGAVIVIAAVAWVPVQLLRSVPAMVLTASVTTVRVVPGTVPHPDWPRRAEAAVGLPVIGLLGVVLGVQATSAQPSELGLIFSAENLLGSVGGDLEHAQVIRPGTVLGSVSSAWTAGPAAVAVAGVSVIAWPGTPVTITGDPPPARACDQPRPARRAGHRHDRRRRAPHHPGRQPGGAGASLRWLLTRL